MCDDLEVLEVCVVIGCQPAEPRCRHGQPATVPRSTHAIPVDLGSLPGRVRTKSSPWIHARDDSVARLSDRPGIETRTSSAGRRTSPRSSLGWRGRECWAASSWSHGYHDVGMLTSRPSISVTRRRSPLSVCWSRRGRESGEDDRKNSGQRLRAGIGRRRSVVAAPARGHDRRLQIQAAALRACRLADARVRPNVAMSGSGNWTIQARSSSVYVATYPAGVSLTIEGLDHLTWYHRLGEDLIDGRCEAPWQSSADLGVMHARYRRTLTAALSVRIWDHALPLG